MRLPMHLDQGNYNGHVPANHPNVTLGQVLSNIIDKNPHLEGRSFAMYNNFVLNSPIPVDEDCDDQIEEGDLFLGTPEGQGMILFLISEHMAA